MFGLPSGKRKARGAAATACDPIRSAAAAGVRMDLDLVFLEHRASLGQLRSERAHLRLGTAVSEAQGAEPRQRARLERVRREGDLLEGELLEPTP